MDNILELIFTVYTASTEKLMIGLDAFKRFPEIGDKICNIISSDNASNMT